MKRLIVWLVVLTLLMTGCQGSGDTATSNEESQSDQVGGGASASEDSEDTSILQTQETEAETVTSYSLAQSPTLDADVASGDLESIEDRLPVKDDIMVENLEEVGTYGGAFQFAFTKASWNTGKPIEQGLFRFKEDGTVEPNVAKSYEVNDDNTVYTIHLREGMKWSDGVDFTAEDCVFFYNHMCVPETFGKSLWDCFKVDDPETGEETIAQVDLVDDYTYTVTFQYSKPNFIENLAINGKWMYSPKHYQETILPEFIGEEKAAEIAEEMGFADVADMGKQTGYYFWNVPGIPTLNPYVLSTEDGKSDTSGDYYEYVRNPYYWKTDQAGNQLPYIDKIEVTKIADESQNVLKVLAGETTIANVEWADIETLNENAESVGYTIDQWPNTYWADIASQLQLNQTVADDDLRELFQDKRFRQVLSIAVDRDEYTKLISDGWAEARQASPAEGTSGYSEDWATKWTDYDPDKAESLLQEIGMVKGDDGYYDFADGKDFVLNLTSYTDSGADSTYVVLKNYFDAIGIKTTYKPVDQDVLSNEIASNDYEAVLGPRPPAETANIALRPDTVVPVRNYAAWYGQIGNWYSTNGEEGYEPTGDLLELCNLYDELKVASDDEERQTLVDEILQLHEDNIWIIGYMGSPTTLLAVDNTLHNFKEQSVWCDEFRNLGIAHIDTCFFGDAQ